MSRRLDRWSKEEIRTVIIFLNAMGADPVEIDSRISEVCGQHTSPREISDILAANENTEVKTANSTDLSHNPSDVPLPEDDINIADFLEPYSDIIFNYPVETSKFKKMYHLNRKYCNDEVLPITDDQRSLLKSNGNKDHNHSDSELYSLSLKKSSHLNLNEMKDKMLYKKVLNILEELSPQKCFISPSQIKHLDITTEESLSGVISLVFEKAINKPQSGIPCANMCKLLIRLKVPCSDEEGQFVDVSKHLLTKCQEEFEKYQTNGRNREERNSSVEECETDEERKLQEAFKEEEQKNRRRLLGNIRFMGWLFKLNILTESMMHQCIKNLLLHSDEVAVECVCLLLTAMGNVLENDMKADPVVMESYFSYLKEIVAEKQASSRVKHMLDDLTDLRMKKWISHGDSDPEIVDQTLNDPKETHKQERVLEIVNGNSIRQENQCSPLHIERKKQLDRKFLLNLQSHPLSMKKPPDLPNLDMVKDKMRLGIKNRDYQHSIGYKSSGKTYLNTTTNQMAKLHAAGNAWSPLHSKAGTDDDGAQKEEVAPTTTAKAQVQQPQQTVIPAATTVITRLDSPVTDSVQEPEVQDVEIEKVLQNDTSVISDQLQDSPTLSGEEIEVKDMKDSPVEETPKNQITLKYSYKEDQWSPLNPEGKKQYDREFLLNLQSQPMSMKKPSNLPNLDVIKDKATLHKLNEVNSRISSSAPYQQRGGYSDPFEPGFIKGNAPGRPMHPVVRGSRGSQQGRGNKVRKITLNINTRANQQVKLHVSGNAWTPSRNKFDTDNDDARTQLLYRKVRGILNKLTPQKFQTLVTQVRQLDITTEESLNGVIDLVFEKAIDEPNFSVLYANMCKQLALLKVNSGMEGQSINFRKLLLTKCQREIEDRTDEQNRAERMKLIEECEMDGKRKQLQEEFEEDERKNRRRRLGNIRFIGRLFKLGMLTESIMHQCIKKLLFQGDEDSLECLCRLLTTIGKELENEKKPNATLMESYFTDMKKTVDKRKTSSRVRFMLQDVIDLRACNWVPRRDENNPKTHKEAEKEAHEQQQMLRHMTFPKRMPDDRDQRKNRPPMTEDGWNMSGKSSKGNYSVDPLKLKLTKKLEFTTQQVVEPKLGKQITSEEVRQNLQKLLSEHESNEEIFNWLERHIEGEMSPPIYRALVTVICESVITGSGANCELNASKLKERMCILARYMDVSRNLELHAIFALQYLMNKLDHPKGILLQIFDLAYNEDFLSADAFKQWEHCSDPAEQEGKGVAIHSVSSFFTWLEEGDDDESADGD